MAQTLEEYFEAIANEYHGEYYFTEAIMRELGGAQLPHVKHYLTVTPRKSLISFYMEFWETAVANVSMEIKNANNSKIFNLKKRSHLIALFSKNKKSLIVQSGDNKVARAIEKMLEETGLERIARDSLFDPSIKFKTLDQALEVELLFSMAFKNKEKVIRPMIEFLTKLDDYMDMEVI